MTKKTRLELTWPGKENRPALEPRILIENPEMSYHAEAKSDGDLFDNLLIKGDNLLALKALEADYAGKVKCVFIDPPYNTGSAFEHYDDGLEHSIWLTLMRDRLECIYRLLSDDGSLWVTLDDNEAHYFKVMCDEIFGRSNFIGNVVWEKSDSPRMDAIFLSNRHDHLLVYCKNSHSLTWNRIPVLEDNIPAHYDRTDDAGRRFYLKPLRAMGGQGDSRESRPNLYFAMINPDGQEVFPKRQDGTDGAWRWSQGKVDQEKHRIEWVNGRSGWTPYFRIYADTGKGRPIETIWFHSDVGSNRTSKAEVKGLFPDEIPFGTPKPERLLSRIIHVATHPGDLVLDSFAGSGTTGAVAHKMGRRWIMVEIGDHADTLIVPRLRKVIDGSDQGGISKAMNWESGGGFRYCTLAPSLLAKDAWGNWVIDHAYRPEMLAEAMCKHLGFRYAPSQDEGEWWRHGQSSETDFLYVTTQSLTHDALKLLSEAVGPDRTLLICARAFAGAIDQFPNLMAKKIPSAILSACEWGRDDYSLNVSNLPVREEEEPDHGPLFATGETDHG